MFYLTKEKSLCAQISKKIERLVSSVAFLIVFGKNLTVLIKL